MASYHPLMTPNKVVSSVSELSNQVSNSSFTGSDGEEVRGCYGLIMSSQNSYAEVLTPSISQHDWI